MNLLEILNKQSDFKQIIKENKTYKIDIDAPECFYYDEESNTIESENLPAGRSWDRMGNKSVDVNVLWYPDLSPSGFLFLIRGIFSRITHMIKYKYLENPFSKFEHWLFVFDHISTVIPTGVKKNTKIPDKILTDYLNEFYLKIDDSFYIEKNDPTCIICTVPLDLRDGYSHSKIAELLTLLVQKAYKSKSIKFKV